MKISTNRLIMTELSMDMAAVLHINSLDEDNRRFVPDEVFETIEEAEETISFLTKQYASQDGPLVYAVVVKENQTNIGYVQLVPIENGQWEIGYHIAKPYTGKGYCTEAVAAFLPQITEAVGITEVYGIVLKDNLASIRVLEKCGFSKIFEGPDNYQGQKRDLVKYIKTL